MDSKLKEEKRGKSPNPGGGGGGSNRIMLLQIGRKDLRWEFSFYFSLPFFLFFFFQVSFYSLRIKGEDNSSTESQERFISIFHSNSISLSFSHWTKDRWAARWELSLFLSPTIFLSQNSGCKEIVNESCFSRLVWRISGGNSYSLFLFLSLAFFCFLFLI